MRYEVWTPLPHINGPCFLERYYDDVDGVRVILSEVKFSSLFRLKFDGIAAAKISDRRCNIHRHDQGFKNDWSFYILQNSNFKPWSHGSSPNTVNTQPSILTHYVIGCVYECIDILTHNHPTTEWLPIDSV